MEKEETQTFVLEKLSAFLGRQIEEQDLLKGYDALGADSMDMVALAFELEKAVGRPVRPEVFIQFDTIAEAVDALVNGTGDE